MFCEILIFFSVCLLYKSGTVRICAGYRPAAGTGTF